MTLNPGWLTFDAQAVNGKNHTAGKHQPPHLQKKFDTMAHQLVARWEHTGWKRSDMEHLIDEVVRADWG